MSSQGYATPLRFEVAANTLLQRLTLVMALSVGTTLLMLPIPIVARIAALLVLLIIVWRVWCRRAELGGVPVQLVWDGEQRWWWCQGGREDAAELLGESTLASRLLVLNFRLTESGRRQAVVLTPAAVGDVLFRRLSVRFRISPRNSPV